MRAAMTDPEWFEEHFIRLAFETTCRDLKVICNADIPFVFMTQGPAVANGKMTTPSNGEHKIMFANRGEIDTMEISVEIGIAPGVMTNAGIYLFASNAGMGQDRIDALNVQLEIDPGTGKYFVRIFEFQQKYKGMLLSSPLVELTGRTVTLRVVVKQSILFVFLDDAATPILTYQAESGLSGNVGLRSQNAATSFDRFYLKTAQYREPAGDRTLLEREIVRARKYSSADYTPTSFAPLAAAIEAAERLTDATQSEYDAATRVITDAINGLVARADLTALLAAVESAGEKVESEYTAESWGELMEALAARDGLDGDSTQSEVDAVTAQITAATESLVKKPVEKGCGARLATGAAGVIALALLVCGAVLLRRKRA